MAVQVISNMQHNNMVKQYVVTFDLTGPNYVTGGDLLTPAMLGLNKINYFGIEMQSGYVGMYDYTNQRLLFYWSNSSATVLAQITNATDLTGVVFKCLVVGS
jgi:hypothetical protein